MGTTHIGIELHHPIAFWIGTVLLSIGVLLYLPDYLSMRSMGYRMSGMPMSKEMLWGMASIIARFGLAAYGLLPQLSSLKSRPGQNAVHYEIHAMDSAELTLAHWWLLSVLGMALVIDYTRAAR